MNGKIYFNDLKELAEFLQNLVDSTSTFEVKQDYTTKQWVLTFTGGF